MPLMAHKEHGFHQAQSGEVEELKKTGWELCADPIEYKARVWGIGTRKTGTVTHEAESQAPAPSEPGDDGVAPIRADSAAEPKRRGRPPKDRTQ